MRRGNSPSPASDASEGGHGLSSTVRRGAVISGSALVFVQVVSLGQTLVLARILSPAEVGIFYSGTVLTTLMVSMAEGGIRNALVQRGDDFEAAANTAFVASVAAGTLWSTLALAASPLVALVFDSREAGLVAAVSSASLLLFALTYVPDALMQRRFDFRQRMIVQPSYSLTFAVVSIALCLAGMGVWGLVVGSYASQLVWVATSWWLARWRPRRGQASFATWRQMARYGLPLVYGSLMDRAKEAIDTVVVGSMFAASAVGYYRYGRRLGLLPGLVIIEVGSYVLFPAFARAASDITRFRAAYLRALRVLWFAAIPVTGMILAFGTTATVLLLGEPWREAGVVFTALAASGPGVALAAVGYESIKGHGRTSLLNVTNGVGFLVGVGLLLLLAPYGPGPVGLSVSASSLTSGALSVALASRLIGVPLRAHLDPLVPPIVAGGVAVGLWWMFERGVAQADDRGVVLGALLLTGELIGFLVTYLVVLACVAPDALRKVRTAIFP